MQIETQRTAFQTDTIIPPLPWGFEEKKVGNIFRSWALSSMGKIRTGDRVQMAE